MGEPPDDPANKPPGDGATAARPGLDDVVDSVRGVQQRVSELANKWLEGRFGAREGEGPMAVATEIGSRAEQFVRGFFRGLVDEPEAPDAGAEGAAGASADAGAGKATGEAARALKDAIPGMDQAARLLTATTRTVSDTFQDYLRENAVDASRPDAPVVIDGRFVVQHGTQLLGRIVQALGGALAGGGDARGEDAGEPRHDEDKVPVKLDLGGLFRSLVLGSPAPEREAAPAPPAASAETKVDGETS